MSDVLRTKGAHPDASSKLKRSRIVIVFFKRVSIGLFILSLSSLNNIFGAVNNQKMASITAFTLYNEIYYILFKKTAVAIVTDSGFIKLLYK